MQQRFASVLVVADHDNKTLSPATLNTVTAASKLGDVVGLVAGKDAGDVAKAMAAVKGVGKVLHASSDAFEHFLPENVAPLVRCTFLHSSWLSAAHCTYQTRFFTMLLDQIMLFASLKNGIID